LKLNIHHKVMIDVNSYSADHIESAIQIMKAGGAPGVASVKVERVGSHEHPVALVSLEWSVPVEVGE
jgi:hypothetical protein